MRSTWWCAAFALSLAAPDVHAQEGPAFDDGRLCQRVMDQGAQSAARGDLDRAFTEATAAKQSARAAFLRGCQLFSDQKPDKADDEFEKAVKVDDRNPVYHFWLGRAFGDQAQDANPLRQAGLARKTKAEFERAAALAPDYLDAREGLVEYYLQAPGILGGSKDKARAEAAEIGKRDPYRGGNLAITIALRTNDTTAAIRGYDSLIAAYPDSAGLYASLATLHGAQRRWPDAWKAVDRLNAVRPDWPPARYAIGRMAAESGERLEQGEAALRAYLTQPPLRGQPSHAGAHWRLGMIAEKRGDRPAARREYEAALALDPALKGAKDGLARVK
jgi:tetratricopeptide (TPR) repeat protein